MNYYVIEQEVDRVDSFVVDGMPDIQPAGPWYSGERFEVAPVTPIVFDLERDGSTVLPDFFDAAIPVFSARLCQALRDAGVHNFDAYPASLRNVDRGETISGYFAVNIIGLVACADMQKSEYLDPTGTGMTTVFFSELRIDPVRSRGLDLFRLAESVGELLVSDRLLSRLRPMDLVAVRFHRA